MKKTTMKTNIAIQNATEQDLEFIKMWLKQEQIDTEEGFFPNWNIIEKVYQNNRLIVLIINDSACGFAVCRKSGIDILEIHPDFRKRGYGRFLVQYIIDKAYEDDLSVVRIECEPETSIPFWKKMGFTVYETKELDKNYIGYKVLERKLTLLKGKEIPFSISFYPEEVRYEKNIEPFKIYRGIGSVNNLGEISLPERAICFYPQSEKDPVVLININGKEVYKDKVKRSAANSFGVQGYDGYVYYLDKIVYSNF